jgi:hypothetical protein
MHCNVCIWVPWSAIEGGDQCQPTRQRLQMWPGPASSQYCFRILQKPCAERGACCGQRFHRRPLKAAAAADDSTHPVATNAGQVIFSSQKVHRCTRCLQCAVRSLNVARGCGRLWRTWPSHPGTARSLHAKPYTHLRNQALYRTPKCWCGCRHIGATPREGPWQRRPSQESRMMLAGADATVYL